MLQHVLLAHFEPLPIVRQKHCQLVVKLLLMVGYPQVSQLMMIDVSDGFSRHCHAPQIHNNLPAVLFPVLDAAAPSGLVEAVFQSIVRNRIQQFIAELVNEIVQNSLSKLLVTALPGLF